MNLIKIIFNKIYQYLLLDIQVSLSHEDITL